MSLICRIDKGNKTHHKKISNPSWQEVEHVLKNLNDAHNDLYLQQEDQELPFFSVSGGREGRYLVSCVSSDDEMYILTDKAQSEKEFTAIVGGQETPLNGHLYVSQDLALEATRYFFEKQDIHPALEWEKQGN